MPPSGSGESARLMFQCSGADQMGFISPVNIINIICDITACVFLVISIIYIAPQTSKRGRPTHLLAAAILILAGTLIRVYAALAEMLPDSYDQSAGVIVISPALVTAVRSVSFIFVTIGITESVTHVIYMNEDHSRDGVKSRYAACAIFSASGVILFGLLKSRYIFPGLVLMQFGYYWLYLYRNRSDHTRREYMRASLSAVIIFMLTVAFEQVRLKGLGLAVMLVIMCEQYHNHLSLELAESEAELVRSKVQLLAEQISPHYIYNSLQSISALCDTDAVRARNAIDSFSEYLRSNLESLTSEEFIPFTRELEHTKAYLELERLSGLRSFTVEYRLKTTDFRLPPLVLQPVVENAVRHGSSKSVITIATRESGGNIYIDVTDRTDKGERSADKRNVTEDPGKEVPVTGKRKSIGLENVRTRLAIQCGGTIDLESIYGGTKVTIMLPGQVAARAQQKP